MTTPDHNIISTIQHLEDEAELSPWEEGFLSSIKDQFEEKGYLTAAQYDKLMEIYDDKIR